MKIINISLLGIGLGKIVLSNKYDVEFSKESISKNLTRLTNQLWKLIPMRENNENWQKQLDTVIIEIVGLNEIFLQDPQFLQLLSKLEGLRLTEIEFNLYRKTVFEAISLLQGFGKAYDRI